MTAMTETSERATGFVQDLGDAVKQNPLSAALIGMGMVWLFANRGQSTGGAAAIRGIADAAQDVWQGASSNLQSTSEGIQSGISSVSGAMRDQVASATNAIGESGSRIASHFADRAEEIPERAASAFDEARTNLSRIFRRQPLALGAVGLAIGAAVAASLPMTEAESEYLGETSDQVKERLGDLAEEKAQQATEIGQRVFEAMADEAQKQGLTTEGLKSTASELSEKVTRLGAAARPGRVDTGTTVNRGA
jgi:gas vesicle protein